MWYIYTDIPFGPTQPEKCELQVLAGGRSVFMIPSVCVVVMFNGECGWGSVYAEYIPSSIHMYTSVMYVWI